MCLLDGGGGNFLFLGPAVFWGILKVVMGLGPGAGLMGYVSNVFNSIEGCFCDTEVAAMYFFHSGSQS